MGYSRKYTRTPEGAIATYDFTEIAEGTGIVTFNGFNTETSGAITTYKLTNVAVASDDIQTITAAGTVKQVDFETLPFKLPKIIDGTSILRFSGGIDTNGAANVYYVCTLFKVSDATTTLVTVTSPTLSIGGAGTAAKNFCMPLVIPRTHFKPGDYLRLSIGITPSAQFGHLAHDPENRDGTVITPASTYPTRLEFLIPFRIDI